MLSAIIQTDSSIHLMNRGSASSLSPSAASPKGSVIERVIERDRKKKRETEESEKLASSYQACRPWAAESRMLAVSGPFTPVVLCQLIGFCKWDRIDQEKSIAPQLGCPFIETSSHHPLCPPPLPQLHPRASIHTHTHTHHH